MSADPSEEVGCAYYDHRTYREPIHYRQSEQFLNDQRNSLTSLCFYCPLESTVRKRRKAGLADVFYSRTSLNRHHSHRVLCMRLQLGLRGIRRAIMCMRMEEVSEPRDKHVSQSKNMSSCLQPFLRHREDNHCGHFCDHHDGHVVRHLSVLIISYLPFEVCNRLGRGARLRKGVESLSLHGARKQSRQVCGPSRL